MSQDQIDDELPDTRGVDDERIPTVIIEEEGDKLLERRIDFLVRYYRPREDES